MTAFNDADLRYIAGACRDEGANVPEWRIADYAEELEARNGETPSEDQVIAHAVSETRARIDQEYGSLALYSTAAF